MKTKHNAACAVTNEEQFATNLRLHYETMRDKYDQYAVSDVRSLWLTDVDSQAIYPQGCFYRAYEYATHPSRLGTKGVWLVHGECALCFGCHAWVELPDGFVFDGVFQRFYGIEDWEKHVLARAWYKYTSTAAFLISCNMPKMDDELHNWGNWHIKLNLPFVVGNGKPLVIDEDKAEELIVLNGLREEANRQDAKLRRNRKGKDTQTQDNLFD